MIEDMKEIFDNENYDIEIIPKNGNSENKTGITFKGSQVEYIGAHEVLKLFFQKKGDKFSINNVDVSVIDLPKNKPVIVEVKPKNGMSGKVNFKVYDVNTRGSATIMVQKAKGGDFLHVKTFAVHDIRKPEFTAI